MNVAQGQATHIDGLTPMGVRRLRELRSENTALRAQIATLEQELERERIEHHVDTAVLAATPKPPPAIVVSDADPPGEQDREAESSGPGNRESPSSPGRRRRRIDWHSGETQKQMAKTAGNALFYIAMVLILVGAFLSRGSRQGAPVSIGGYSGMLVLTASMEEAIPKGSLIITKSVPAEELAVGDDISYMVNPTTSVTHRIISVHPQADGTLSFQTQGVSNPTPDSSLVPAFNIVGQVIYHSLLLGLAAKTISENWPLLLFLLAVWTALGKVLVRLFREDGPNQGRRLSKTETQ